MGLFHQSGLPDDIEVLRAIDATKPRRRGAVLLAIMAVVTYFVLSLEYKGQFWTTLLILMPWMFTAVVMAIYIPSILFAADNSEFVYLDEAKRHLVFVAIQGGSHLRRDVPLRDVASFNIEREQIRSTDSYSDTTYVQFTLVARTAKGDRLVIAGPIDDSNPSAQDCITLSAVRARLDRLAGLTS